MPAKLPTRLTEKPSIEVVADYFREGRVRLRSAKGGFPSLSHEEALIALHEAGGTLDPSTVRVYLQQDQRVLRLWLRYQGRSAEYELFTVRLTAALNGRRGKVAEARTSARKVVDATEAEAMRLFYELKRQALSTGNVTGVMAALFVLVAGHCGMRPIELIGARLE